MIIIAKSNYNMISFSLSHKSSIVDEAKNDGLRSKYSTSKQKLNSVRANIEKYSAIFEFIK